MADCKRLGEADLSSKSSCNAKKAKRQTTKSTFEKWQREHEKENQRLSWLRCDLDTKGTLMVSLYCATCRKYVDNLRSLKTLGVGSTNQRTSNLTNHASSDTQSCNVKS